MTAAHGVGVLHKDLKPTNVLLASVGGGARLQVRVADFGSGTLLTPERLERLDITPLGMTETRSILQDPGSGTPMYLAPELIAGRPPTIQSDVYALGLILYQLVVGDLRRPMASGWEHELADPLLAGDIAAATHTNPLRRLTSVSELTQRLRTLESRRAEINFAEAMRERAAHAERALERWRAQRPWVFTVLVTLALGLIVSVGLYRSERQAHLESAHAVARADAINRFLSDDLLGAMDPSGPGGAHNPTMREVLARTADTLDARFANF